VSAVQLPYHGRTADRRGRRLFRKQVLPVGTLEHPAAGRVDFGPSMLSELARNFKAGALDVCPFTLADAENRHSDDPERVRGTVRDVEATSDGLYATIEATPAGAALLADHPSLPVSVRLKRPESGPFRGRPVLAHVCGTLDPLIPGMAPWQTIDASDSTGQVLDLSAGSWKPEDEAAERRREAEATVRTYDPGAVPADQHAGSEPPTPTWAEAAISSSC